MYIYINTYNNKYIYICLHTYIYTYIYILDSFITIYMCIPTNIYTYIFMYNSYVYIYIYVYIYTVCIYIYIYICICMCVYICIYIYIYIFEHLENQKRRLNKSSRHASWKRCWHGKRSTCCLSSKASKQTAQIEASDVLSVWPSSRARSAGASVRRFFRKVSWYGFAVDKFGQGANKHKTIIEQ